MTGPGAHRWTPLRLVLVLAALTSVVGFLAKSPCRTHGWVDEYQYTRACYTDVYALYYAEGLDHGPGGARVSVPYRDHPVEYPPVIGGLMWAAAEVTAAVRPDNAVVGGVDGRAVTFFDLTALALAVCTLGATWAVARLAGRRRVWDAAMLAVAPGLFLHEYTNWDMAAVVLTMLGLWAWSRGRCGWGWPAVAGGLLGLAIATKLYPVLIVLALGLLCLRAGRWRAWAVCAAAAAGTTVLAYLPAYLLSAATPPALRRSTFLFPDAQCPTAHFLPGWRWFWSLNQTRGADWDSLWYLREQVARPLDTPACGTAPAHLNLAVALATLTVVLLVAALVLLAARRPRLPQVAFLLVAGFLLVNKVDSPQYVLWLIPLAVLARPRWVAFVWWQFTEAVLLFARYYFFVGNDTAGTAGVPPWVFYSSVLVRDAALLAVMGLVVRDVLVPRGDVVRRDGVDDPAGGPLDKAADRVRLLPSPAAPAAPALP